MATGVAHLPAHALPHRRGRSRALSILFGLVPTVVLAHVMCALLAFALFMDERYAPIAGVFWMDVLLLLPTQIHLTSRMRREDWPAGTRRLFGRLWCAAGLLSLACAGMAIALWPEIDGEGVWIRLAVLTLPVSASVVLVVQGRYVLRATTGRRGSASGSSAEG
jgi:hypothetical protein